MTIRTTERSVIFERPFMLGEGDGILPAGTYRVETDEERLEGASSAAYRRVSTRIYLRNLADHPGMTRVVTIVPSDLDAALERDHLPASATPGPKAGQAAAPRTRPRRSPAADRQAEERADNEGMMVREPFRVPVGQ